MSLLEIKGFFQSFGGLQALNNINLNIERGEIVGIIGPNGAGKSTLFNTLLGLTPPKKGSLYFEGKNITDLPVHKKISTGIVKTSQTVQVFDEMTVLDNVLVGALNYAGLNTARNIANESLQLLDLTNKKNHAAGGLPLAERAKLELARAFTLKPKILMVDELMAGLNENEVSSTLSKLKYFNKEHNITLCVIEHNMEAIMKLSDRVVVMEKGEIILEGDPVSVSKDPKVIEAYLGVK